MMSVFTFPYCELSFLIGVCETLSRGLIRMNSF